jgi:hypothetical protein
MPGNLKGVELENFIREVATTYSHETTAPGNDLYVITVGAMKDMGTTTRTDDLIASYSSTGARFDEHPELLFRLHEINENELIAKAGKALPLMKEQRAGSRVLGSEDVSAVFGLEMALGTDIDAGRAAVTDSKAKTEKRRPNKKAIVANAGQKKPGKPRSSNQRQKAEIRVPPINIAK